MCDRIPFIKGTQQFAHSRRPLLSEGSVRYVEVPRKPESAEAWLQQQTPALATIEPGSGKVN
jgi:hypothetical protein